MGKKKNQVPVGTLKEQVEGYLFDCISEFEYVSGLKVDTPQISIQLIKNIFNFFIIISSISRFTKVFA